MTWARNDLRVCAGQDRPTILKYKPDTILFLVLPWWAAWFTLGHYVYGATGVFRGTLCINSSFTIAGIFASMQFISVPKVMFILCSFLASTICYRIILIYEISGMRHVSQSLRQRHGQDSSDATTSA
ncbi:hypothetical protein BCR34DRAFT_588730 [Clohesyomyces aquaticus]|uniref:Uncharacterized protein n=1 Tax=Clohesyomyces aquaticus TaxID=1231657 RepID=A0A1Y1ZJQ4_9PLEO|nr:hypothetical protein BCR34DRAFT_588730 [Clohesyomyces aquaticus]